MRAVGSVAFSVALAIVCIVMAHHLNQAMHQQVPKYPQQCPPGWFLDMQDPATVATCQAPYHRP